MGVNDLHARFILNIIFFTKNKNIHIECKYQRKAVKLL